MTRSARPVLLAGVLLGAAALLAPALARQGPGGGEGRGGFRRPPSPLLQALDKDGDGTLSEAEIAGATAALKTLDRDGDGTLSQAEMMPEFGRGGPGGPGGPGGGPGPEEIVAQMMASDRNGDGKLAKDELPRRMQPLLERADANGDGFLDRDELTAFARRRAPQPQGGPGGGRRGPGAPEGPPPVRPGTARDDARA
jgi:Ca2+-binding EF-hand superfamily protein